MTLENETLGRERNWGQWWVKGVGGGGRRKVEDVPEAELLKGTWEKKAKRNTGLKEVWKLVCVIWLLGLFLQLTEP